MTWLNALVPFLTSIFGAFLGFWLTSRAKRDEAMIRFREEKYAKLLVKLQGFVGLTSSTELKKEFFEEQYQSWLYASDEVVQEINSLVRIVIEHQGKTPDPKVGQQAIGNIVVAMRRDLMTKSTTLSYDAFRYTDVVDRATISTPRSQMEPSRKPC
ncbi:hypothetical protein CYD94_03265 [Ralstonia solanacearum]|uniref:hypothetical protein n=1 Tax=Ralstonia pseudosolanacearum TaxID=1310165 RepID=UPI000C9FDEA3|nr:hypothetical protein [Ralstonia pseudosolanacearum]AUS41335.1 hypothetical protein CYD94_03265 [Ralstonia solanacearum]